MKVAIYARVSTPRQAETQTIEQQIERLKTHVEAQGWLLEPEQIYRDDGHSGANLGWTVYGIMPLWLNSRWYW
jgi:site-specific DNA recombinase